MGLNKPEQDLKRDLLGVASDLKWSAVELRVADRLSQIRAAVGCLGILW